MISKIPTPKGILFGMKLKRVNEVCGAARDDNVTIMTYKEAHNRLGHISKAETRRIAKMMGWKLVGEEEPCDACAVGKAQQQNAM